MSKDVQYKQMSKIGKKIIEIPQGVDVQIGGDLITVKGQKGTIVKTIPPNVIIKAENNSISIQPLDRSSRTNKMYWGLARSLVQNMVTGANAGFEKVLEFQGVGYKAAVKGKDLELGLGFSHPVTIPGVEGITFVTEKNSIKIQGVDKELVGKIAALIRDYRLPEPYKGSGIRYQGEVIKRKAGKKAATAA
ncbi:MAG: 50S ribosomal protein L6 [Candidatus Yanofskybacteria bacterium GW2011_GWA1_48_10]|uniref:Large ribosomal subunit protein uL6 n=2 Tax=Candidatus Yanofskyibacteriota TaxID=1752733 RepID=A0A0G1U7A0_9BACT|nr:MAG: 50S ribosomal protein L6 [Candidatus Yanofskybacteria bacterium GW2011_GWA1_48_10]